ncbi:MAG TPA: zinc ribbon domain-containing protein, partial [Ktedonobacteraceae bacterium]|nr:zinc ribbon domain-containing protein [Ktedonobacteraceae bacterium]
MQCSTCGFTLPAGATFCTNCGAKIYNQGNGGNQPGGFSEVDPTIAATPYQTPPNNPSQNPQGVPPTVYGAPYSTPQQYSYDAPPPPPSYGTPPPNAYGAPPNSYGTPNSQTPGYSQTPGTYAPGQPPTPPPARKGPRVVLIIGIIVLIIVVVGVGLFALRGNSGNSTSNTVTPTATTASSTTPAATVTSVPTSVSGTAIDPAAAAIIFKAQTASAIDSNDFPTHLTSNFAVKQDVYITFQLKTKGQAGYAEAKLYSDTSFIGNKILTIQPDFDHGYFTATLNQP